MSRKEFMEQLERLLMDIPQEERIEALSYYNGYFEDAGAENEASIIEELESPEKVAKIIKADVGVENQKEYTEAGYEDTRFHQQEEVGAHAKTEKQPENKEDRTLKIVLLVILAVFTSPVWLGLTGALIGVAIGLILAAFGILLAFAMVVLAFYIAGLVLCGVGIAMFAAGMFAAGLGLSGSGMLMLTLAILGTIVCVWLFGKLLPWMIKGMINLCSRLFQRKGRAA